MAKQLFIIDAMALAYRSFFAFGRPLSTSDGVPTSAVFGTAMFMNKLIAEQKPDYLAVVTDTSEPTFRHEIYRDYKATREAMPDDLARQLPFIYELFSAYGCKVLRYPGYEADDVIGTLAKMYAGPELNVFIVSGDKDFLQLVDQHVYLFQPKKNEDAHIVDVDGVKEIFNCTPDQVIDALALMGDKVDNVPGVPGIGEKSAAKLIGEYGSLEEIYAHIDKVTGKRQKENLLAHKEDAFLSRELVTIDTSVAVDVTLDEFKCHAQSALANDTLLNLYRTLEFRQLVQKTEQLLGTSVQQPISVVPELSNAVERSYRVVTTWPQDLLRKVSDAKQVAIALDYENCDFVTDKPTGIAIYLQSGLGYFIPVGAGLDEQLKGLLQLEDVTYIAHGWKRCLQLMWNAGLPTPSGPLVDTAICDYLLDPNSNKHTLDFVAPRQAGIMRQGIEDEELVLDDETVNQLVRDAEVTHSVSDIVLAKLGQQKMTSVLTDIEMPLVPILAQIEQCGVYIDADFLIDYSTELNRKAEEVKAKIFEIAEESFNLNSPKQMQRVLFEKLKVHEQLGVKKLKRTKTGFSTDELVLSQLNAHPLPRLVLEYRMIAKLKGSYVDTLPQHIHPKTKRLHTTLHQTVAATGRLSSDNPNLQNIPMRSDLGRRIRKAFVPQDKDDVIVAADYSQVEIRLLAHLAGAEEIISAFKAGLDVHRVTAARIFGVEEKDVTGVMRSQAKAVNFGIIYGMGPQRLAQETGVTLAEAKEFIAKYFEVYPGIKKYTAQLIRSARDLGYSTTICGRRRPIIGITDRNRAVLARAENIAVNAPIQGSAADIIKLAMIRIHKAFKEKNLRAKMLLQIHDELLFSVPKVELDETMSVIQHGMEHAFEASVPLSVDIRAGSNWLEAH